MALYILVDEETKNVLLEIYFEEDIDKLIELKKLLKETDPVKTFMIYKKVTLKGDM